MAIAFVQGTNTQGGSSVASVALAFVSSNTAGNCIFVAVGQSSNAAIQSISDSHSNSYTAFTQVTNGAGQAQNVWYALNIAAGANTVTVNFSTNASFPTLDIVEYSGVATSSAQDGALISAAGSGFTASAGNLTTTNANDIVLCACITSDSPTVNAGTGFTKRTNLAEDDIVTSTGTYTCQFGLSTSQFWIAQAVALKAAVSGTGQPMIFTSGIGVHRIL